MNKQKLLDKETELINLQVGNGKFSPGLKSRAPSR